MEPTNSILYHLELQRQTIALAGRDDDCLLALSRGTANGLGATGINEDGSAERGKQSSTLDLSDMLIEAAGEMDSDWLDFRPFDRITTIAKETLFGVFLLLGVAWFTWVCLSQAFLT